MPLRLDGELVLNRDESRRPPVFAAGGLSRYPPGVPEARGLSLSLPYRRTSGFPLLRRLVPILVSVVLLVPAAFVWRASSRPDPIRVTTVTVPDNTATTATTATTVDELAVWQLAVWQAAVWDNATRPTEPAHEHPDDGYVAQTGLQDDTGCPAEIVGVIREAFAGTGYEDWAVGIAWRESRCQPGATNPNGCCVDSGIFQLRMPIHEHRVAGCDVFDPACNARGARSLFDECSTGPWTPPYSC